MTTRRIVTVASLALALVIAIVTAACGSGTSGPGGTDLAQAKPPQTQAPPDKAPEPAAAPASQSAHAIRHDLQGRRRRVLPQAGPVCRVQVQAEHGPEDDLQLES